MKLFSFLITSLILLSSAQASFEKQGTGTSNVGLSLSGVASKSNDFSVFTNPSLIGANPVIDLFYRNHYGIKDLNQMAVSLEFSLFNQPMGVGIIRYGNNLYSETEITYGTSYQINTAIFIGLSLSSYFLQIKDYGDAFSLGLNFSIFYEVNEQLRISGTINNINDTEIGVSKEKIPVSGTMGISYSPIQEVEMLMDAFKEEYFDFAYRLGIRIKVISKISILAGFQDSINSFSAGLEIIQNNYAIKYSVDIHPVLNASHAIGIKYVL